MARLHWVFAACLLLGTTLVRSSAGSLRSKSSQDLGLLANHQSHEESLIHRTLLGGEAASEQLPDNVPPGLSQPGNALTPNSVVQAKKPMLFFLFLVYVKINNHDVWNRFFSQAVSGVDYRALVHCKDEAECRRNIRAGGRFEVIRPVETQYCFDLVSGMNELLRQALTHEAAHPNDKFIFVSDSTLPLKPFRYMQQRLTVQDGQSSNFCIFPRNEWAEVTESFAGGQAHAPTTKVGVKHHQWMILSRTHAEQSVSRGGMLRDLMQVLQLNQGFRNTGCLDEFWHFATLFHQLSLKAEPTIVELVNFAGGSIRTDSYEIQGQCDTFVHWPPRAAGTYNNITKLAQELSVDPGVEMQPPTEKRPSSMSRLSKRALTTMRQSPFLFLRKVDDNAAFSGCHSLPEAFEGLVFADNPGLFVDAAMTWPGQGVWLDNRKSPVTITSLEGSISLQGASRGEEALRATGYYCGDQLSAVFSNQFRATAKLWCRGPSTYGASFYNRVPCSQNGSLEPLELQWDNGVVWEFAAIQH